MKRGCEALYYEDQLLVLCEESYPSDHIGFHDPQYGHVRPDPLLSESATNFAFSMLSLCELISGDV